MRRFPSDDILADYAAGSLPPGMSLLVASHLTFCPESRRRVADLERVAGAVLSGAESGAAAPPPLAPVLARLDAPEAGAETAAEAEAAAKSAAARPAPARRAGARSGEAGDGEAPSIFPVPLRRALGMTEAEVPWRFRLPGLADYEAEGFEGEEVGLLRARPGAPMFSHTHSGVEATLILSGAMADRGHVYTRGEVSLATSEDDHRPRIVGEEVCICLVVMTGSLRFTGPLSRALNLLGE